jgi:hypothetical protein
MSGLELRYRRLLAVYPRDHRQAYAEEMIGVLLAGAREGQRHPGLRETADLLRGALKARIRRAARGSGDRRWQDALAVVSVLAPVLLLAYGLGTTDLLGIGVTTVGGFVGLIRWSVEYPFWLTGSSLWPITLGPLLAVIMVTLRLRRTAAIVTLAATVAGVAANADGPLYYLYSPALAVWILLGLLATAALLLSPGPRRGLEILHWWGMGLVVIGALALATLIHGLPFDLPLMSRGANPVLVLVVIAAVTLGCLTGPLGRRVVALLAIPAIPLCTFLLSVATPAGLPVIGAWPVLLYLPPVLLVLLIVARVLISRSRAASGGATGPATTSPSPGPGDAAPGDGAA